MNWIPTEEEQVGLEQLRKQKDRALQQVKNSERALIDTKLAPLPSFIRGVQVGALFVGGANTIIPGQFGVIDWPLWLRVILGGACVLLAVNYLLAQRGFMIAKRISRA